MEQQIIEGIPVDLIDCQPQVRSQSDVEGDAGLAQSIAAVGVLVPVIIRRQGTRYVTVDGHRRCAASLVAGRKTVPAIVIEQEMTEASILQTQLITAAQREDLRPGDRARGIQALMQATGWNMNHAAEQLGLSVASISRSLTLLRLPPDLLRRVDAGELPASAAYELAKIDDPKQQAEFLQRLTSGQLTRDSLSRAIKAQRRNVTGESPKPLTRAVAVMEGKRLVTVSGSGLTLESFITCLEELLSKARKARQQPLTLGTFLKTLKDQQAKA
jgi:ParB/RepB/Spo0J family partition protein